MDAPPAGTGTPAAGPSGGHAAPAGEPAPAGALPRRVHGGYALGSFATVYSFGAPVNDVMETIRKQDGVDMVLDREEAAKEEAAPAV